MMAAITLPLLSLDTRAPVDLLSCLLPMALYSPFIGHPVTKYGILYMNPFIFIFGQFLFLFPAFDISKYVIRLIELESIELYLSKSIEDL